MLLNKVSLIGHKILKKDGKINAMIVYPDGSTMSTDGVTMVHVSPVTGNKDDFPDLSSPVKTPEKNIYIEKKIAEKAIKSIPKKVNFPVLKNLSLIQDDISGALRLASTDLDTEIRTTIPEVEFHGLGKRTDKDYFKRFIAPHEFALAVPNQIFSLQKLSALLNLIKEALPPETHIKVTQQGETSPLLITATDPETEQKLTAVIMPMRE